MVEKREYGMKEDGIAFFDTFISCWLRIDPTSPECVVSPHTSELYGSEHIFCGFWEAGRLPPSSCCSMVFTGWMAYKRPVLDAGGGLVVTFVVNRNTNLEDIVFKKMCWLNVWQSFWCPLVAGRRSAQHRCVHRKRETRAVPSRQDAGSALKRVRNILQRPELVLFQWLPRLSLSSGRPNLLLLVSPCGSQSAVLSQVWPFSFK